MIDFANPFGLFLLLLLVSQQAWPVLFLLGALAGVGALGLRGGWRWTAAFVSVLLLLAGVGGLTVDYMERERIARSSPDRRDNDETVLESAQTVDGMALPAGTDVVWDTKEHKHFWGAVLPGPTPLLGTVLDGTISLHEDEWRVRMDADAVVDGWTCKGGIDQLRISVTGRLKECVLSANRTWRGRRVPAGSRFVGQDNGNIEIWFGHETEVPDLGVTMKFPKIAFAPDGSVAAVRAEWPDPLVLQGAELVDFVIWRYAKGVGDGRNPAAPRPAPVAVSGSLKNGWTRAGRAYDRGTTVTLWLNDTGQPVPID